MLSVVWVNWPFKSVIETDWNSNQLTPSTDLLIAEKASVTIKCLKAVLNNFVHMDAYVCHVYISLDIIFLLYLVMFFSAAWRSVPSAWTDEMALACFRELCQLALVFIKHKWRGKDVWFFLLVQAASYWIIFCPTEQIEIIHTILFHVSFSYWVWSGKRQPLCGDWFWFNNNVSLHTENCWVIGRRYEPLWLVDCFSSFIVTCLLTWDGVLLKHFNVVAQLSITSGM